MLFDSRYGLRTITLNRPKKLNSLNGSMARKILSRLLEWQNSQLASVVVIKGEGRAFCAGGDVAWLAEKNAQGKTGQQESKDYFALEFGLDHLIATYSKPYVAFIDGITMGGGVGLSVHAPFRIATENTVFAMPETTIGYFPDVGASFFLPRLDGSLGTYLALTSTQLRGVDVFMAGLATHYLHSSSLPDLEARLSELKFSDHAPFNDKLKTINTTIEEFCTGLPPIPADTPSPIRGDIRSAIDYAFQPAFNTLEAVLLGLEGLSHAESDKTPPAIRDWAVQTRKTLLERSPTSLKVTLRALDEGAKWGIGKTFLQEHVIASRFMEHPDFIEGVTALLVSKPKRTPIWSPSSADRISDRAVDAFFTGQQSRLQLLASDDKAGGPDPDYAEYPHAWLGLPRERLVQAFVEARAGEGREVVEKAAVEAFVGGAGGKQGVKEKVEEILRRKTKEGEGGSWGWVR